MAGTAEVKVAGHTVRLSSPDRVMFPQRGFTKKDVFDYYLAVGDGILRALHHRPTTLQRFPEGIEGEMFFQKRVPARGVPPSAKSRTVRRMRSWSGERSKSMADDSDATA